MERVTITKKRNGRYYLGMSELAAAELIGMTRRSNVLAVTTGTAHTDAEALYARMKLAGALDKLATILRSHS